MSTALQGRHKLKLGTAIAAAAAFILTACGTESSGGDDGKSFTVPTASDADRQAAIETGFLNKDLKYDDLNPVVQRTINKVATKLTTEQWSKLQECMKATSCETGHGKLTVAFANDGINPWRQTARADITAAAIQSPEIKKIVYTLGEEVPKFIANVNSLVAQKTDIILMNSVYGAAVLPAVQAAKRAGVTIIQWGTPMPDEVKSQLSGEVDDNLCDPQKLTADALIKLFPNGGTYGLYTGVPGNGSAAVWQPCLTEALDGAGWTKVIEGFTNWTEQGMAQQGNALFASGKNPDFVAYDYALEDFAAPYIKAGKTPPILGSDAANYAYLAQALEAKKKKGITTNAFISTARQWFGRAGLEYGLMLKEGEKIKPFTMPSGAASQAELLADYDPSTPPNAPIAGFFTAKQEEWILSAQG